MAAALWTFQPSALQRYARRFKSPSKTHIAAIFFAIFLIQRIRRLLGLRAVSHNSSRSAMPPVQIPGFTALNDQIYVREPDAADGKGAVLLPEDEASNHPDVVMVFGWGDGLPKHVAKYTDGFRVLFPRAKQIICLSPIAKAMFSEHQQRSESMKPIIDAIFPEGAEKQQQRKLKILAHTMSNTGAVNFASVLNLYQQTYNTPFPLDLHIMDSTPGSTDFTRDNLLRWSRAMALGTANWFPWPFAVTQSLWAVSLCINWAIGRIKRTESAGAWARKYSNNTHHTTATTRRLYMYSKEDDLISWEDIISHAAESRRLGWEADVEEFSGSGHVGHMRKHTDQYWKAILDSWERAVAAKA
jgi:hypothetical protein